MTTEEKLLHFQETALTDARRQSSRTLKDYQDALEKVFAEHKEESRQKASLKIQTETDRLNRESNKQLSLQRLEIRKTVSKKQKELADKLFVEVKNRLEEFMNSSEYEELLARQIRAAQEFSRGADFVVYLDPADARLQNILSAATGCNLKISAYSFMGGTRAVIPSRKVLIDNSFQTKLSQARENFILEPEGGDSDGK